MELNIKNNFITKLPSDTIETNYTRQVPNASFSFVKPTIPSNPKLIDVNTEIANSLGITTAQTNSIDFLNVFSGKEIYPETQPFAMNYAGHQFGNWAGQLGDGRAINLFEIENNNQKFTIQLKGAGKTPYSRNADGLAVLRSSIREYLCAEAMHHLGIPTTRSLSLVSTGNQVLRDMLYDGNPDYEKGAIVARVAPSFIRFGSFEVHAARQEHDILKQLADFTIENYFNEIKTSGKQKYVDFFNTVCDKTREMIIHWQRVGFVHGVMNTDNMSIHGITIDYGPYGWLEDFDLNWTPNTTDSQNHRYAYGNQPDIALWNLYQLANALYPLIEEAKPLEEILNNFGKQYDQDYLEMMKKKLGMYQEQDDAVSLVNSLLEKLQLAETDYTIFFRNLSSILKNDTIEIVFDKIKFSFYDENKITETIKTQWYSWIENYLKILNLETISDAERQKKMNLVNPKYVLRNYMAQLAIDKANEEDYSLINELFLLLQKPYDEQPEHEKWFAKRPDWAREKVGCSMLSCSS
jgi:serine/tyrosine/threonine adenylyltransferase